MSAASGQLGAGSARRVLPGVADVARRLTRARCARHVLDHVWAGALIASLIASVAVLTLRIQALPWSRSLVVLSLLLAGALIAALVGWLRRPGEMETVIRADLDLRLKQQLSTAWELLQQEPDSERTRALVEQAVRARLPARAELVFPLRLNVWGRLLPAAALLLVLVSIVDLPGDGPPRAAAADPLLRQEGERLREYAREMRARARARALERAQRRSGDMEALAARMESGDLGRGEALSRLRELGRGLDADRREALSEGRRIRRDDLRFRSASGEPAASALDLQALLDRLLRGDLRPGDLDSGGTRRALESLGVTPEALAEALRSLADGESRPLEDLLRGLDDLERQGEDASELAGAEERLQEAREALGDAGTGDPDAGAEAAGGNDDEFAMDDAGTPGGASRSAAQQAEAGRPGGGGRGTRQASGEGQGDTPRATPPAMVLQPRSLPGEGEVFISRARVLPRASAASGEAGDAAPAVFDEQVESVLSQQQVPLARRELVRRYFLNLGGASEASADDPEQQR